MKTIALLALSVMLLPAWALAQQNGASVTGHVYDPSGAPVAGATITARWTATGAVFNARSDSTGLYHLPFLNAGQYEFTVEKQGFRQILQTGVTLTVAQKAMMNFKLQLGSVTQTVNVNANAPLLQTESGDQNWTIDSARLAVMPLAGLNTIETTWFAPGVTVSSAVEKIRGFDTGGMTNESIDGGQDNTNGEDTGNSVLVDGISINGNNATVNFNPINDTVQEVNVQSPMYDAEYGWSTGAVINTITRGGTNAWHGDAYEDDQNTALTANTWGNNRNGVPRLPWHINMWGGSLGGPVKHNKLFLYFAYQETDQVQVCPFVESVPTAAEKAGDFSQDYAIGATGQPVQQTIYDPLTTQCSGSPLVCTRQAFPGNIIPADRMSSVAKAVLGYIPAPNTAGAPITGLGNFVNTAQNKKFTDIFPQYSGRLDYNYSDKTHLFFRYSTSHLTEARGADYSTLSSTDPADIGGGPLVRENQDFTLQITHIFSPTTVLEFRTGMNQYKDVGGNVVSTGFNLSTLGFSPLFVSQANAHFPTFGWSNYAGAGSALPALSPADLTYTNDLVLSNTRGRHNLKVGLQWYFLAENTECPGDAAGNFGFNGEWTGATPLTSTSLSGNSIADFLLGYPDSGYINVNSSPALSEKLWSVFGQDDIHVSRKLTLTAGLRWDYNGPLTDRFNALNTSFCETCQSPLQVPGLPLQGGLEFAGVDGNPRGIFNPYYLNFGPRVGFAYQLRPDTVLRGGYGMIYASHMDSAGAAPGFSQTTNANLSSVQEGVPNPTFSLENPFPTGILLPVGSKYGLASDLAGSFTVGDPDMNIPRVQQYSLDIQHQFGSNWLVSAAYVGSWSTRLRTQEYPDATPLSALALGTAVLDQQVPNPFLNVPSTSPYYSLMQGTYLENPTVSQARLDLPYPQFSSITEDFVPIGRAKYDSLQVGLTKRLSAGLDFSVNYTWANNMDDYKLLYQEAPAPSWYVDPAESPQQLKISARWDLPFGPGKYFGSSVSPVLGQLIGGWYVSGEARAQAGFPMASPSGVAPTGNPETIPNPSIEHWFNTCTLTPSGLSDCSSGQKPAWQTLQPNQLTTWSPYLNGVRLPGIDNLDLRVAKDTEFKERYHLNFAADFLNATNTTEWYGGPNTNSTSPTFGEIANYTTPSNDQRVIMLSLRFQF